MSVESLDPRATLSKEYVRSAIANARVTAVANGKGGCGKTSTTVNVAGALARAGFNVLIIDFDTQGHVAINLGFADDPERADGGRGILDAVEEEETPLIPAAVHVRPNLDVVPGGRQLKRIMSIAMSDPGIYGAFAEKVARLVDTNNYDFVFIDCPPGNYVLQLMALVCSRYIVVPVTTDPGDWEALREIGGLAAQAKTLGNDSLDWLGYFVFAHQLAATKLLASTHAEMAPITDRVPPFQTIIRYSKSAAQHCRLRGQLIHELADDTPDAKARFAALRNRQEAAEAGAELNLPSAASQLSVDYLNLSKELLQRYSEYERRAAADGAVN